jgi:hypothetical protein
MTAHKRREPVAGGSSTQSEKGIADNTAPAVNAVTVLCGYRVEVERP